MDGNIIESGLMAETLIVLAGENAWSGARGFAQLSLRERDVSSARYWRNVARGVLKTYAARLAASAGMSATPSPAPVALETAIDVPEIPAAAMFESIAPAEMSEATITMADATEPPAENGATTLEKTDTAVVDSESRRGWQNVGRAPIPLRARRQLAAVPVPADVDVEAAVSEIEFAIAKAA